MKEFQILSERATLELAERLGELPPLGGLVHVFDPETCSLATVSVVNGKITGWSVYGPQTEEEARADIESNQPKKLPMQ